MTGLTKFGWTGARLQPWPIGALALYGLFLALPLPPRFEYRGIEVTDELLLLTACTLTYAAFVRENWKWKTIGLAAALAIFTVPLLRVWETAASSRNLLLGLLPFLDASGYYSDSLRLMAGRLFEHEGVYRPLFATFLALVLKLLGGNLQIAMLVCAMAYGLGVFVLATEVRGAYGPAAGVAVIVFLQFFYRQFAGALLTEQLGVPVGALALAALLRSLQSKDRWLYLLGVALLSLALEVRAGAYLVLPALLFFGWRQFAGSWRRPIAGVLALMLAMILPWFVSATIRRAVAPPGTTASPNFAMTLYGQATPGGVGWIDFAIDHEDVMYLPRDQQGPIAYRYAFEAIKQNPFALAQSSVISLVKFASPAYLFDVFRTDNQAANLGLQIGSCTALLAGLWISWKKRADARYGLLLAGCTGVLLSVPFLPPWDGGEWWGGIRIHAATLGFHLTVAGIGISKLVDRGRVAASRAVGSPADVPRNFLWIAAGVLTASLLISPYVVRSGAVALPTAPLECVEAEVSLGLMLAPGAFVQIEGNDSGLETYVPVVLVKDVHRSLRGLDTLGFRYDPRTITRRAVFLVTNDLITGERVWVVGPPELAQTAGRPISACGTVVQPESNVVVIRAFR